MDMAQRQKLRWAKGSVCRHAQLCIQVPKLERLLVLRAKMTISEAEHGQLQVVHAACGWHTWHVRTPLLVVLCQLLASCGVL